MFSPFVHALHHLLFIQRRPELKFRPCHCLGESDVTANPLQLSSKGRQTRARCRYPFIKRRRRDDRKLLFAKETERALRH